MQDRCMNHSVNAFDRNTELLVLEVKVPSERFEDLAEIIGWTSSAETIFEYDLSVSQIRRIEALIGKAFYDDGYDYQLSCSAD